MEFCYINGEIKEKKDASVSVLDIGFLRGFGLYEALTSFNGKPFMLNDHLDRFEKGANFLNLKIPESREEIKNIIKELLNKNIENNKGFDRYNIKFILTGGEVLGGIDYNKDKSNFCILTEKFSGLPKEYFLNGVKINIEEYQREFPEIKTTNYLKAVMLQKKQKELGAFETLYFHNGKALECTTSNFFIVKDNKVITAKDNILKGITRKVVLDLAKENNILVEERDLFLDEIWSSDEVFITASFKEVLPVVNIDGKMISNGSVGEITKKMIDLLSKFIEAI